MLRPIEPVEPDLSSKFFKERIKLASNSNVVEKRDYRVDAARNITGLAPYLECWEQHRRDRRLPSLRDFDALRETIGLSGVHLVETPTAEFADFRFASFDSTTRLDGHDFSGTYVSSYPDSMFREAARLDYLASVTTREGCLTRLDFNKKHRGGEFARLVLPISETNSTIPSRLLVVVQILDHRPFDPDVKAAATSADVPKPDVDSILSEIAGTDARSVMTVSQMAAARTLAARIGPNELVTRYFENGIHEQLEDRDLLEWLLRHFLGAERSSDLAVLLIDEFGSLPSVLAMGRERLFDFPGLTSQALLSLKVVRELASRLVKTETMNRPIVSDVRQVIDYCRARMAHETIEHLRVLYIDQKNRLITDEVYRGGGVSSVSVSPRQIVKRAILVDASSIIMAHNHPSGDPSPSAADVEVTRDVKRASDAVDIRLLDHLIIGRSGNVSLRTLGYLDSD